MENSKRSGQDSSYFSFVSSGVVCEKETTSEKDMNLTSSRHSSHLSCSLLLIITSFLFCLELTGNYIG